MAASLDPITGNPTVHSPFDSTHPVLLPKLPELLYDWQSFNTHLDSLFPVSPPDATAALNPTFADINVSETDPNLTRTTNNDPTFYSSLSPVLDLWNNLSNDNPHTYHRLQWQLENSWAADPLATLRVIWNTRSIHQGKGERMQWYRCMGWLKATHPKTLLVNLQWIVRPVIEKKVAKKTEEEGEDVGGKADFVGGDELEELDPAGVCRFDVKDGVSHGYYRDLPNLLVLASRGKLNTEADKKDLGMERLKKGGPRFGKWAWEKKARGKVKQVKKRVRDMTPAEKEEYVRKKDETMRVAAERQKAKKQGLREERHRQEEDLHKNILANLENNPFYRALHVTIARIFAEQLERDRKALESGDKARMNRISLAGKWAPSLEKVADRTTLLATSIAELLFPEDSITPRTDDREIYLKHARQRYRQLLSKLRHQLDIVETKITEKRFPDINYSKVPSKAMERYRGLFIKKDFGRFSGYIDAVATGRAQISGAVLSAPEIIADVRKLVYPPVNYRHHHPWSVDTKAKNTQIELKVLTAQWRTMVQRIRDSGTLESAIAVVDVSGSMTQRMSATGAMPSLTPLDAAIGLGLVVAQVTKEPFANRFITFSATPQMENVIPLDSQDFQLSTAIANMSHAAWGYNTDFIAVFKSLLAHAQQHKTPQKDMVKRIFVFSDMHFDKADRNAGATSFQFIKILYKKAGYDVPQMIFWNLAGRTLAKVSPVTIRDEGTILVSGYNQALLKAFLAGGGFDEMEEKELAKALEEELVEVKVDEKGEVEMDTDDDEAWERKYLQKMEGSVVFMKKVLEHKGLAMLEVVD